MASKYKGTTKFDDVEVVQLQIEEGCLEEL